MPILRSLPAHLLYILLLIATALALPPIIWNPDAAEFIFVIGAIAIWRYSWGLTNWLRFHLYHKRTFPAWRKQADALGREGLPDHAYLLVTSFRIGTETTRRVYKSVVKEAVYYHNKYDKPITIIASIVEPSDQFLIKSIYLNTPGHDAVTLSFVRIAGTGKRDALACGFRAISMMNPPENAVAAVVDGDSMLPEDSVAKCASMFAVHPKLGALTTDEVCEVDGAWKFREWYSMRFAQRNIFMSSVALSRRVLTLTGRMSMFRCDILCNPDFVERVELDWVDHWRLGRFKFLTGDDKSSWYHILRQGYEMIYVSDVNVVTIETPPHPSFITSSLTLMRRWFGNMLRTNDRAIRLGPAVTNWFPWLSIVDQRISMWTSLTGFTAALLSSLVYDGMFFVYYLWWMLFTRYIITLSLWAGRDNVSVAYPFLLYYNQIVGSLVKTFVLFRLDKQKWTRQNTTLNMGAIGLKQMLRGAGSLYMQVLSYSVFVVALATILGMLHPPDIGYWQHKLLAN